MSTLADSRELIANELAKPQPDWILIERLSRGEVDNDPTRVRFSVDAGHIQRLGQELVSKQETALSELIKNAYDGDATKVTLTFENHDRPGGRLVIVDDGLGMTQETIRSGWMRISTTYKVDQPLSPTFGRHRAGEKGIGRFAVHRLGKHLILETGVRGSSTGYRLKFDWEGAFDAGISLDQVFSSIESYAKDSDDQGTRLEICELRDAWSASILQKVWRAVLLLQPPFSVAPIAVKANSASHLVPDPGFEVVINGRAASRQAAAEFNIKKSFLDHAFALVEGQIDIEGNARVWFDAPKLGVREEHILEKAFLLIGPIKLTARYFIYDAETMSGIAVNPAAEMGRLFGGIRIYRNGFRVPPYGEQEDDWLDLDKDVARRHLLYPTNNRHYFGQVELDAGINPFFEETSSREGLLENQAYWELKSFVRSCLEWTGLRIAAIRNRKQTAGQRGFVAQPRGVRKPSEVLQDLFDTIEQKAATASEPPHSGAPSQSEVDSPSSGEEVREFLKTARLEVQRFEDQVERERAAFVRYEEMLRILASLGLSIAVFGHEIKGGRTALAAHLKLLASDVEKLADNALRDKLVSRVEKLRGSTERVFDLGGYIAGLMSSTESRELQSLSVIGAIDRFARQFGQYMSTQSVQFAVDVEPASLRTVPMHASEFDSVLLNFLTNSIKSMKRSKVNPRLVRISARPDGAHVRLSFEDNGGGIPADIRDRIFDAFFTTTMATDDDGVAGPGTGLGLKIVSDIAQSYGGSVSIGEPNADFSCRFDFLVLSAQPTKESK